MHGLTVAGIEVNRKMLAEMAVRDANGFAKLAEQAKAALGSQPAPAKEAAAAE